MHSLMNYVAAGAGAVASYGWSAMAAAGGAVGGGAPAVAGAAGAEPPVMHLARQAGVTWVEGEDGGDGHLEMEVGSDMQALMGIGARARLRRSGADVAPPVAAQAPVWVWPLEAGMPPTSGARSMQDATDLMGRRLVEVRRWLSAEDTQTRLRERGLTVADVEVQLRYNSGAEMRALRARAARGETVFPFVSSAHLLFSHAVRDADMALLVAPLPGAVAPTTNALAISTTSTHELAAAAATAVVAAPVAPTAPDPLVDLVQREKALRMLAKFHANFFRVLPQVAARLLYGLWDVVHGDIDYQQVSWLAATFPCATSLTTQSASPHWVATYPQGEGRGTHVRKPMLNAKPVVVARSENSSSVRVCIDGLTWIKTPYYTDDVVEAAKLEVWKQLLPVCDVIYRRVLENSIWMAR